MSWDYQKQQFGSEQEDLENVDPRIKAGYRSSAEFYASKPKSPTNNEFLALLKADRARDQERNGQQNKELEQPEMQEFEVEQELEAVQEGDAQLENWQRKNGGKQKTWRETGKLRGDPPVRSQTEPPNKNIVEDEATYKQLLASVKNLLKDQRARAEAMKDEKTGVVDDYKYWFTKVYSYVTENMLEFIEQGTFYYPTAVLHDVLYFDKIFADNLKAPDSKREDHWRTAWNTASKQQNNTLPFDTGEVVLSLVAGMLAHIRFDLPRALAWVARDYHEKFDAKIHDLQHDFFSMSGVFDNATRDMVPTIITEMRRKGLNLDANMVRVMDWGNWMNLAMREGLNADMSTERLLAWERAVELYSDEKALPDDPYQLKNGQLQGNVTNGNYDTGIRKMNDKNLRPDDAEIRADSAEVIQRGLMGAFKMAVTDNVEDAWRSLFYMTQTDSKMLKNLMPTVRAKFLLDMIKGSRAFHPAAQEFALELLKTAPNDADLVLTMDIVGAYDLLELMSGSQQNDARQLLEQKYYPETALNTVVSQIVKWTEKASSRFIKQQIGSLYKARTRGEKEILEKRLNTQFGVKISEYLP
jgi:Family of unknown function (DUF5995)